MSGTAGGTSSSGGSRSSLSEWRERHDHDPDKPERCDAGEGECVYVRGRCHGPVHMQHPLRPYGDGNSDRGEGESFNLQVDVAVETTVTKAHNVVVVVEQVVKGDLVLSQRGRCAGTRLRSRR